MEKKSKIKKLNLRVEIVAKSPYAGSGPRGVDVYATHLYNGLASSYSRNKTFLSRDKTGKQSVDLVHYTFFDPFFLTLWSSKHKSKYVVTVHDLIPLKFPNHFPVGIKGKIRWYLQKRALLGASAIITDSTCSKNDIEGIVGYPKDQIYVVPLAAGHTTVNEKMVRMVRTEYDLPERYLLYVGDINWNKNIPGLIKAFGLLNSKQTHLVLVGKAFESGKGTVEYQAIQNAIDESGKSDFIHMLGFIPSHHLPAIYRGALLYVQPSWYEGFGFPILEAMEQGIPVASASTGSLPEVGGEFAHYFDPNDVPGMTTIIKDLLRNKQKREKYVEEGKQWARTFTWDKVIEQTHAVYEKIVG
jgi:glycosyltransferase involved in cell wall biosynthesis